jgi:hypothetical protein
MARIFISYNRASSEAVEALAGDLLAAGHQVWFDRSITGGHQWWNEILENIRQCDLLIFALSRESVQSHACQEELDYASRLEKAVLPLLVADGVQTSLLPRRLGEIQFIDYRSPDRRAALALARAINGVRPPPPLPDPLPEPPPVPMSYLNDLRDQVDGAAKLSFQEQAALLFELKGQLEESDAREAVLDLLHRMRRRDDLLARLAGEIDAILADATAPLSERKAGPKAAPAAEEAPAARPVAAETLATEPSAIVSSSARTGSETDEIARILLRIVQHRESWMLGNDPQNHVRLDPLLADGESAISATLTCRDNVWGKKAGTLKEHGWRMNDGTKAAIAGGAGAAILYATSGLGAVALLSKKVRDYVLTLEGKRTWHPGTGARELIIVAEELWDTLQTITPELKIVPMKQLSPSEKGKVSYASS